MSKRRKRFNSKKTAESFALKVNGQINDLREVENAKSPFTVTYESNQKTKEHGSLFSDDWCPEENRDFGYSNDFWN